MSEPKPPPRHIDDLICRPATFMQWLPDGGTRKTFHLQNCGDLVVIEQPGSEPVISITYEPKDT